MDWDFSTETRPTANKEYRCDAAEWLINMGWDWFDATEEELAQIEKAKSENWNIQKDRIPTFISKCIFKF